MADKKLTFYEKVSTIQTHLHAPKNLYNSFGKYKYRNAEGICEAVKPLLWEHELILTVSDDIREINGRFYVEATATITDGEHVLENRAFAREAESKSGMDAAQITGAASSYARKYALNGLFLLDDTKDPDTDEYKTQADNAVKEAQAKAAQAKPAPAASPVANQFSKAEIDTAISMINAAKSRAELNDIIKVKFPGINNQSEECKKAANVRWLQVQ